MIFVHRWFGSRIEDLVSKPLRRPIRKLVFDLAQAVRREGVEDFHGVSSLVLDGVERIARHIDRGAGLHLMGPAVNGHGAVSGQEIVKLRMGMPMRA